MQTFETNLLKVKLFNISDCCPRAFKLFILLAVYMMDNKGGWREVCDLIDPAYQ